MAGLLSLISKARWKGKLAQADLSRWSTFQSLQPIIHGPMPLYECVKRNYRRAFCQSKVLCSHDHSLRRTDQHLISGVTDSPSSPQVLYGCKAKDCSRAFRTAKDFRRHYAKIHCMTRLSFSPLPFYGCNVRDCTSAFRRPAALRLHHETVHLNARNYLCPEESCMYASKGFK